MFAHNFVFPCLPKILLKQPKILFCGHIMANKYFTFCDKYFFNVTVLLSIWIKHISNAIILIVLILIVLILRNQYCREYESIRVVNLMFIVRQAISLHYFTKTLNYVYVYYINRQASEIACLTKTSHKFQYC